MLTEPQTGRISAKALKVWIIYGTLNSLVFISICGTVIALSILFNWPLWIIPVCLIVAAVYTYMIAYKIPRLKWNRWHYEVRESEIELQHGVMITTRTLIPMIRVQHVDTKQGPILKKYDLATVAISTAATVHEIPALDVEEAEELRLYIGNLTGTAYEDV
jgi:uncharacterized protein